MELFSNTLGVQRLEAELAGAAFEVRIDTTLELAWQLRQRDSRRSLQLAEQAELWISQDPAESQSAPFKKNQNLNAQHYAAQRARIHLIRGEISCLFADLEQASQSAELALEEFQRLNDATGMGDARWLKASVLNDSGQTQQRDACLHLMLENYHAACDTLRYQAGLARLLERESFVDSNATAARIAQLFDAQLTYPPVVNAWLASAKAIVGGQTNDLNNAIENFLLACNAALETGQIRQAIVTDCNRAETLAVLGDLDAALEVNERAVILARSTGWPGMIGFSLVQSSNILRLLGRQSDAKPRLLQAIETMGALQKSKSFGLALQYMGDISLELEEFEQASQYYLRAQELAKSLNDPIFHLRCRAGQARSLAGLQQPHAAYQAAFEALQLARDEASSDDQLQILRIFASLHQRYELPFVAEIPEMPDKNPQLYYLRQAFAIAGGIADYVISSEMYKEYALAYAAAGDFQNAYLNETASSAAHRNKLLEDARKRAVALQAREETIRAKQEAEALRQIAETEAKRVEVLQEAGATLETLGLIGREITSSLNAQAVFECMYRHVHTMLDVTSFLVFFISQDKSRLDMVYGMEQGKVLPAVSFSMDDLQSKFSLCARERQEIIIEFDETQKHRKTSSNSLPTLSMLYDPLMVGERLLGVMSIQSLAVKAYGERERSIFRTLCAYGAIALDNASAYNMAETARAQADQALQKLHASEERWAFALEGSGDGVWDWDITAHAMQFSPRWKAMLGHTELEIGHDVDEWMSRIHPDDMNQVLQDIQTALDGNARSFSHELRVLCKDGQYLWVLDRGMVVQRDARGKPLRMVGTFSDITHNKQMEQIKSQFVSTVSHELRTPVTSIRGSLSLLEAGVLGVLPPKALELIKVAHRNSQRLITLVNDILDMDKLISGKMHLRKDAVDLNDLLRQAIEANAAYAASHQVRYRFIPLPEPLVVTGDFDRLMQVMANLMSNAAKFSPSGSTVDLSVNQSETDLKVSVQDYGDGIPLEFQSQIFAAFSQADNDNTRRQGGTGLGLNISKKLIEQMQGSIGFVTEVGVGTTFWFSLPVSTVSPEPQSEKID